MPLASEILPIGQVTIDVPLPYLPAVREAIAAKNRIDHEPSVATLNMAIAAWERVTRLPGLSNHPLLHTVARAERAMALCSRLSTQTHAADLDTALSELHQLLRIEHPALQAERPRWQNALSIAYRKRFEAFRKADDLDRSIKLAFDALRAAPRSIYQERIQNNLGNSLLTLYHLTGQRGDLDGAISAFRAALTACSPDSREWGMRQTNLAGALVGRYELLGESADIEQAVAALDSAGRVITPGSPNWCELQSQRSVALLHRFAALGDTPDLDQALAAVVEAIRSAPPAYPKLAAIQMNHGAILEMRFTALGQAADLDAAIEAYGAALCRLPKESVYGARTQINLGGSLVRRFALFKRGADLDAAISAFEIALKQLQPEGPEWATVKNNIGVALSERYGARLQLDDLNASVTAHREALRATPPHTVAWATRQSNLGSTLHTRFKRLQHRADLEEAIEAQRKAVLATQESTYDWAAFNLQYSAALQSRFEIFVRREDAREILAACRKAYNFFSADRWPENALLAIQNLGAVYAKSQAWGQASEILLEGVELINTVYSRQILDQDREGWLTRAINIYRRASYALARAGRLRDAVVVLEQGRARRLADAFHRDRAGLERMRVVDAQGYAMYVHAVERMRELQRRERVERLGPPGDAPLRQPADTTSQTRLRDQTAQAQAALDAAIARIRRVPGFESYLAEPTFKDVARAVQPGIPLVYLDTVAESAFALVVSRPSAADEIAVEAIWLDRMTVQDLKELVLWREEQGVAGSYLRGLINENNGADLLWLDPALDEMLPQLGERLVGPIAARLRGRGAKALVLLPGFSLSTLPLHAALYRLEGGDACFQDEFDIRYAPSARMLALTQRRQAAATGAMLAVGDPRRRASDPAKLPPAYFADWLAGEASRLVGGPAPLVREAATRRAVAQALQSSRPAHLLLGCHGLFNPVEPLRSQMWLADDDLSLAWLIDHVDLSGTALVTLCSCQTGLRDFARVPDEALGFPAGFLQVGAGAVIAPLWSVEALPTVLLLRHLYRLIGEGAAPSEALRRSVAWLRTMSRSTFEAQVAELRRGLDSCTARQLDKMVSQGYRGPRPFASPRHWAAFTYHGVSLPGRSRNVP
jgi:CHAT domain-containing protein/tetratricopeptide (TPR) repeat protein